MFCRSKSIRGISVTSFLSLFLTRKGSVVFLPTFSSSPFIWKRGCDKKVAPFDVFFIMKCHFYSSHRIQTAQIIVFGDAEADQSQFPANIDSENLRFTSKLWRMLSTNQSVGDIERLQKLPDLPKHRTMYCSTLSHGNSKFIISEKDLTEIFVMGFVCKISWIIR